jgi:hypothetical protein
MDRHPAESTPFLWTLFQSPLTILGEVFEASNSSWIPYSRWPGFVGSRAGSRRLYPEIQGRLCSSLCLSFPNPSDAPNNPLDPPSGTLRPQARTQSAC